MSDAHICTLLPLASAKDLATQVYLQFRFTKKLMKQTAYQMA